jgi:predicted glycosyl hydrolase (DUF1957 family)
MNIVQRVLDVNRLTKQLEEAEKKIKELEAQLTRQKISHANYAMVAKDFDASKIYDEIAQTVVEEFKPIIKESALDLLETVMRTVERENRGRNLIAGSVAFDTSNRVYEFRFEMPRISTTVKVMDDAYF